jgi:ribonuclease Z
MQRIIVLGSAAAVSNATRDNTFLAFESQRDVLLLDCAGSPYQKLLKAGLNPERLKGVILTHAHPDHIYGLPSLIHHFIMTKRTAPLPIYANRATLRVVKSVLGAMHLERDFIIFKEIPKEEGYTVIDNDEYTVQTSPVRHVVPTVAVKILAKLSGASVVYSADTAPCPELLALAREADLLFQECSTARDVRGHTTPWQAGKLAQWCGVKRLVLVHLGTSLAEESMRALDEARAHYKGEVEVAQDLGVYELSAG